MGNINENTPAVMKIKIYGSLLHLLTKLANEPSIKTNNSKRIEVLLVQAENFDWNHVDPATYQQIIDWYLMSCDSQVILKSDPLNLDFRILRYVYIKY